MWMSPVQNQSWVSEFILLRSSSDPMSNKVFFVAFLIPYLSSVLGNGLIVTLICLDMHLHTPMYFFLCILSLLDMGYISTTVPQMVVHLLTQSQTISFAGYWLQMFVLDALDLTKCIFFVIMAYDQYIAICYPLRSSSTGACVHSWQLRPVLVVSSSL